MIAAGEAAAAAAAALEAHRAEFDAMPASWPEPTVGAPVMVEDIAGAPAYWLVPFTAEGHVVGSARVDAEGRVLTIGMRPARSGSIGDRPLVVTLLTMEEAANAARALLEPGEDALSPRFVHDGPRGREAWLVETRRDGRPARWITVTPGGATARAAGAKLGQDSSRE
jgi:hypothetical protein